MPRPICFRIPARLEGDEDIEVKMRISRNVFQYSSNFELREVVYVCANGLTNRILITKIFAGSCLCKKNRMNAIERMIAASLYKFKVKDAKEVAIDPQ